MAERNPYHILGLQKGATEEQIRSAYKLLAKRYHPDRNMGDPTAQARFIEIKEAYEALIERKSSSSIANVVEEKGAELGRKARVLSPELKKAGIAAGGFLGIAAGIFFVWWFLLHDAPLRNGLAAARRDDDALAVAYLEPLADDTSNLERSQVARDAMLAVLLRKGRLVRGAGAPAEQVFAADLVKDQALPRYECIAADLDIYQGKTREALPSYRGARGTKNPEIWARAYAGFLAAGDPVEADALAADSARLADGPWKTWIRSVADLRAGRAATFPDDGTPRGQANHAATLIAELAADANGPSPPGPGDSRYREAILSLKDAIHSIDVEPPLDPQFGYLRPEEHLFRRTLDWRPTTSAEDPRVAMILLQAWAASIVGEYEASVSYARAAHDADANSLSVDVALGYFQLTAKRFSDADKTFQGAATIGNHRFGAPHAGRARVLQMEIDRDSRTVDQQQAIEVEEWKTAISIEPKDPEFHYGYARTLARRRDLPGQIEQDRLAVEADPGFGPAALDLGEALLASHRAAEAVAALQAAAKDPTVAADARFDLGQLHFQRGEYDAALADLQIATGSQKKEVASHAWVLIARVASRQHKLDAGENAICNLGQLDSEISDRTLSDPDLRWLASKYDPRRCPAFGSPR